MGLAERSDAEHERATKQGEAASLRRGAVKCAVGEGDEGHARLLRHYKGMLLLVVRGFEAGAACEVRPCCVFAGNAFENGMTTFMCVCPLPLF